MRFEIKFDEQATEDLKGLRAHDQAKILDWIERLLTIGPMHTSQSRIKKLQGIDSPEYRMRVDDLGYFTI